MCSTSCPRMLLKLNVICSARFLYQGLEHSIRYISSNCFSHIDVYNPTDLSVLCFLTCYNQLERPHVTVLFADFYIHQSYHYHLYNWISTTFPPQEKLLSSEQPYARYARPRNGVIQSCPLCLMAGKTFEPRSSLVK